MAAAARHRCPRETGDATDDALQSTDRDHRPTPSVPLSLLRKENPRFPSFLSPPSSIRRPSLFLSLSLAAGGRERDSDRVFDGVDDEEIKERAVPPGPASVPR